MQNNCFFRTIPSKGKKVLIQVNDFCDMACKHCFLSSKQKGKQIEYLDIVNKLIPFLKSIGTVSVTITGGEPLLHPKLIDIVSVLNKAGLKITVCTNGLKLGNIDLDELKNIKNLGFNVSLDGFKESSYERFRGVQKGSFNKVIKNIEKLSNYNLLKGLLVTPNVYSEIADYVELVNFADRISAEFVLFNQLSEYGRGVNSRLGYTDIELSELKTKIQSIDRKIEIIFARFPDEIASQIKCGYDKILYVYTTGEFTFCPYVSFINEDVKRRTIIGNLFESFEEYDSILEIYQKQINYNSSCLKSCLSDQVREMIEKCL